MTKNNLQTKRTLRSVLLVLLLGVAWNTKSYAYNFSAVAPSGQTLYYTITDDSEHTVMVTHPNENTNGYSNALYCGPLIYYYNNPYFSRCISSGTYIYYEKPTGNLIIPYYVQYNGISYSVTAIDDYAFGTTYNEYNACTGLTSVVIPTSIQTIGTQSFAYCSSLTTVTIPTAVTSIGREAFWGCNNLVTVNFNAANCSSVGDNTWTGCTSFTTLHFGNTISRIPDNGFRYASAITSINIPNSVTTIGAHAFDGCTMLQSTSTEQLLPNALESIGDYAFQNASTLAYIRIPSTVTSIGKYAFKSCTALNTVDYEATNCTYAGTQAEPPFFYCSALATINVSDNVTQIPAYCFKDCTSLVNLTLHNGLSEVNTYAFYGCININSLILPASVTSIGSFAFGNAYDMQIPHVESRNPTPPLIGEEAVFPAGQTIYVPMSSVSAYEIGDYSWEDYFIDGMEMNYSISAIANPTIGGIVSGTGTFTQGETCTLTAVANEGYTFINWTENDELVSTESTYSFEVLTDRALVANFEENDTHNFELTDGWNWFSTNLIISLTQLEEALGTNGLSITTQDGNSVIHETIGWGGDLTAIEVGKMYMIHTAEACTITLSGAMAAPATHPITLNPGANWIGFVGSESLSLDDALTNLTPANLDIIKTPTSSATYYQNVGWTGNLDTLEPGKGYVYKSNASEVKTFVFPSDN